MTVNVLSLLIKNRLLYLKKSKILTSPRAFFKTARSEGLNSRN